MNSHVRNRFGVWLFRLVKTIPDIFILIGAAISAFSIGVYIFVDYHTAHHYGFDSLVIATFIIEGLGLILLGFMLKVGGRAAFRIFETIRRLDG
ncbi:hypothetical protein DRO97_01975 [Archaeoglobales archaeon]|nr:MAG: hypothetical protein DRO97_01975 [Archaeoglobales archaeon]